MQNGILSIIQAINKPNCWQEALIMYLVSENELSKPNQFRCLEIHRLLPLLSKTNTWFSKTRGIFFLWKPSNHHRTEMMMVWRRYNDLFYKMLKFFFDLYSVSCHISKHYSKHGKSPYFVRSIFLYLYQIHLSYQKFRWHITYVWPCNSLNSYRKYPSAKEHNLVRKFYKHIRASVSSIEVNGEFPSPLELKKRNHPFTIRRAG